MSVKWNNPYALPPPPVLIRLDGMLTKIKSNIYALHNLDLPSLFKGRQLILITFPCRMGRGLWTIKKRGGSMVQGQVFLKGGDWCFYLIFSRFIIFNYRNYFILCEIVLYVALCFSITSWKKVIRSCLKMNVKMSHIN